MSEQQTIDQKVAEIDRQTEEWLETVGGRDAITENRELWMQYLEYRGREHDIIESVVPNCPPEVGELAELSERLQALVEKLHYIDLNRESIGGTWNVFCSCNQEFPRRTKGSEAIEDGLLHLAESPRPSWEK